MLHIKTIIAVECDNGANGENGVGDTPEGKCYREVCEGPSKSEVECTPGWTVGP